MCYPRPQLPVGCPLVALAPQRRQNYPNDRPPTRAKAISEMGQEEKSPGECDGCGGAYSECATRLFQHSGERLSNEHQPRTDRVPTGRIIFMVDPTEPLTDTPQHLLNVSAAKRVPSAGPWGFWATAGWFTLAMLLLGLIWSGGGQHLALCRSASQFGCGLVAFNSELRVDPQHLSGFLSGPPNCA